MKDRNARLLMLSAVLAVIGLVLGGTLLMPGDDATPDPSSDPYDPDATRTADADGSPTLVGEAVPREPDAPPDVLVHVRNDGGHPLEGVPVTLLPSKLPEGTDPWKHATSSSAPSRLSDAQGRVRFAGVSPGETSRAAVFSATRARAKRQAPTLRGHRIIASVELDASKVELTLVNITPVDVRRVHALHGTKLRAGVRLRDVLVGVGLGAAQEFTAHHVVPGFGWNRSGQSVFADKDGDTFFTDRIPPFIDVDGAGDPDVRIESMSFGVGFAHAPPKGLVRAGSGEGFDAEVVSPMAARVLFVEPAWPEAKLLLEVPRKTPEAREFLRIDALWTEGGIIAHATPPTITGHATVSGVPFLPGAQIELAARLEPKIDVRTHIRFGWGVRDEVIAKLALPRIVKKPAATTSPVATPPPPPVYEAPPPPSGSAPAASCGAACGAACGNACGGADDGPAEAAPAPKPPKLEELRLRVLRPDGTPAAGAHVYASTKPEEPEWLNETFIVGPDGRVTARGPWDKSVSFVVVGAGCTFDRDVKLTKEEVTLRGTMGGQVAIRVVDTEGRALPFARVHLEFDDADVRVVDGTYVQRVDPYVDHRGRRTLHMVQPGEQTVTATYFHAKATTKVTVVEGKTAQVTIQVELGSKKGR